MEFAEVCFGIRKKDVLVEMLKSRLSIQRGTAFKELESFAREKILWLKTRRSVPKRVGVAYLGKSCLIWEASTKITNC